jgi:NAD(P)-dependent dehydrogenase (short-subunit alcohol dehydrogenase family)
MAKGNQMLDQKSILVTGGGSGIGRASARIFADSGAHVVVADVDDVGGIATVEAIKAAGREASFFHCDVSVESDVAALVEFAVKTYGRLDGAFNNAGIEMCNKPVHEVTGAEWRKVIDIDLTGVFYCIKHEFLAMKESGGGSIVNAASAAGQRAQGNAADYVSAKFGVVGLTKAAAIDGGPLGIRVNAVCPGLIMTPMAQERLMVDPVFSQALEGIRQRHHVGRFGETADVAQAVMWLLSDLSSFVTGSPMLVDGGYSV